MIALVRAAARAGRRAVVGRRTGSTPAPPRARWRSEAGQTLVLIVLALPVMLGMSALVIDVGNLFAAKRSVQQAADAAALAGAQGLSGTACDSTCEGRVATLAGNYRAKNLAGSAAGPMTQCSADVTTNCYTLLGSPPDRVRLKLSKTVSTFFGGLIGQSSYVVSAMAVGSRFAYTSTTPGSTVTNPGSTTPTCTINGISRPDLLPDCKITGVVETSGSNSLGGAYIYADGDLRVDNSSVAQPVVVGGDLDLSKGTLWPVAHIASVGGRVIYGGNPTIGNGGLASLTVAVPAGAGSTGAVTVASTAGFNSSSGQIMMDEAGTDFDEWIQYPGITATTFKSPVVRAFGGFGVPAATAHPVGTPVDGRLYELHAKNGCSASATGGTLANCSVANKIWARTADQTPIDFTKPTFDVGSAYANAAPGPNHPCEVATKIGTPPTFDNNTTLNGSASGAGDLANPLIDLTPGASYRCTSGTGEITWDNSTSGSTPKTLTVHGTIFFDGNITFSQSARYVTGSDGATIFTSRNVNDFTAGGSLCAGGTFSGGKWICDFKNWDPAANLLGLVAGTFSGSTFSNCMAFMGAAGGSGYQGAFYMDGYKSPRTKCENGNAEVLRVAAAGATVQGLFVAGGNARWSAGSSNPPPEIGTLPQGFPGEEKHCFIDGNPRDDLLPSCVLQGQVGEDVDPGTVTVNPDTVSTTGTGSNLDE